MFPEVELLFRALQAPLSCCFQLLRSVTIPVASICSTHGSAGENRITEYSELEGTHKDHQLQFLILHRTPQESHCERCQSHRRGAASASSAAPQEPCGHSDVLLVQRRARCPSQGLNWNVGSGVTQHDTELPDVDPPLLPGKAELEQRLDRAKGMKQVFIERIHFGQCKSPARATQIKSKTDPGHEFYTFISFGLCPYWGQLSKHSPRL